MSKPVSAEYYVRSSSDCPFPAEPLHGHLAIRGYSDLASEQSMPQAWGYGVAVAASTDGSTLALGTAGNGGSLWLWQGSQGP